MTGKSPVHPKGTPLAAQNVIGFEHLSMHDVERVGGKNASLGEMIRNLAQAGVRVPGGFATTAGAYREFLSHEGLDARIHGWLKALDVDDTRALAETGKRIRDAVLQAPSAKLPAFVGVDLAGDGYAVVKLLKVLGRDPAAGDAARTQAQYAQAWGDAESQAYYEALKARLRVEVTPVAAAASATAN